jgi:hypothetical protein
MVCSKVFHHPLIIDLFIFERKKKEEEGEEEEEEGRLK